MPTFDAGCYKKLIAFDKFLDSPSTAPQSVKSDVKKYIALSTKQTTDPAKRVEREALFVQILQTLNVD
jgi:hypothetical protein